MNQAAVAVNRGQAVAELVRDARGELAHPGQRLLEPQLLFELRTPASGPRTGRSRRSRVVAAAEGDTVTPKLRRPRDDALRQCTVRRDDRLALSRHRAISA